MKRQDFSGQKWVSGSPGKLKGVKGAHPLGCLPLWGREGVTLVFFGEARKKFE